MKAIVLKEYNPNLIRALKNLELIDMPVPKPRAKEVLVQVEASPVNPSDIAFLRGGYNIVKPLPAIPGFEGTGKIVAVGTDVDSSKIGERVSFFTQSNESGAWAEFCIIGENDFIPLSPEMPLEQAACFFVNPFTAYALMEHLSENQHQAIIQSAAMGQVGNFIRYFAREKHIKVINLVRKEAQEKTLREQDCKNVLNTQDDDFGAKLSNMAGQLNATGAIDAVGGELTGHLLNAMPAGSELMLYGGLSGMPISAINPLALIFENKILSGFNLNDWLAEKSGKDFEKISHYIQQLFIEGKLKTQIHETFALDDFYAGLRAYIGNMSAGKVLLRV
jgi:NADPH:quinone reductase-like Zn-dependent oxidoreductase